MKQELPVNKKVYERNSVANVINRDFTQFLIDEPQEEVPTLPTVDEFFEIYEQLFFDIPKEGEYNSHQYMIAKSSEYLGIKTENSIDIQLLQEEITSLRQQLLDANQALSDIKLTGTRI